MKCRWSFLIVGLISTCTSACNRNTSKILPIYNPSDFNMELVDVSLQSKHDNHTVSAFELINQNGKIITQEDYKDKVYVVDFFFTKCPSICPIMIDNMVKIQK
ncbi:SCO family protein [Maribacter sp. ACAM166]|uniref:SCO family protein n=1 Tax=Maribacter sp. ACAM166 TaxID=2508996 RepID=UPI0021D30D23|nr:SCO family protein [Maribacter sp. ACAM166]